LEAIAGRELDRLSGVDQSEPDRSPLDDDDLVVVVVVRPVPIARAVRPRAWRQALGSQPLGGLLSRHAATPISDPTTNVTVAAAAPIRTWRAPENTNPRPVSRLTAAPTMNSARRLRTMLATNAPEPDARRYGSTG